MLQLKASWIKCGAGEFDEIQLPREEGKSNKMRIIPLFPKLRRTVEEYCARNPGEYVFMHGEQATGDMVRFTTFSRWWNRVRLPAGVKDVRIHGLRGDLASCWIQRGGHLAALKEMLGHADIRMIDRYAHLNADAQRRAMEAIRNNF